MKCKLLIIGLFIILGSLIVCAQEWYQSRVMIAEVWADFPDADLQDDLSQTLNDGENKSQSYRTKQDRVNKTLQDVEQIALHVYSDMIFGYTFEYTPSDARRNIQEKWVLTQIANIPSNDPHLYVISRDVFNNQISVVFRYDLTPDQFDWLQRWQNVDVLFSKATGSVSSFDANQVDGKYQAMLDAYKKAIRVRLRDIILNKPLLVRGIVRLDEQPHLIKTGGYYEAKVKVAIKVDNVKQQQAY